MKLTRFLSIQGFLENSKILDSFQYKKYKSYIDLIINIQLYNKGVNLSVKDNKNVDKRRNELFNNCYSVCNCDRSSIPKGKYNVYKNYS